MPRVRRRGHEDEVPIGLRGQPAQELVALVLARTTITSRPSRGMGLIDDDKVGRVLKEAVARFYVVDGGDDHAEVLVDADISPWQQLLETSDSSRLEDGRLQVELVRQLLFHCSQRCGGQSTASRRAMPRSSNSRAMRPASIVLPTPTSSAMRSRTHGLVSKSHDQRDELVGPRSDRDLANATGWAGAGAQSEPARVSQ
ncbi:hypothetical protein AYO38_09190 [bacterium SCGC AG-212-C10]|nr:hypothetical protein AYO38_09190 [bacterium SCGC AG-212-C10]